MSEYLKRVSLIEQDKEQCAAFHSEGSQVVLAGPGSGKTYLLTTKAAKLLLEGKVRYPQKLACITFSRQLAYELVKKFRELGVYDRERMYVGTIHAFCIAEILMPAVNLLPQGSVPEPFRIASAEESREALSEGLKSQGKSLPQNETYIRNIESDLDKFRRRYFLPEQDDFLSTALPKVCKYCDVNLHNFNWSQFAKDYRQHLRQTIPVSMDFVEIEMLALRIVKTLPMLATTLSASYPWWFVDEYQDLSPLFHQMVTYLVQSRRISVFAIGDPNQCIYEELQGSNPKNIKELSGIAEQISQTRPITLQTNYRSSQNLIELGSFILGQPNPYKSNTADPGQIHVIELGSYPYQKLVARILKKAAPGKIAVLTSRRAQIKELLELEQSGLDMTPDKDPQFGSNTELVEWVQNLAQWCSGEICFYELLNFCNLFFNPQGRNDESKHLEMERELFYALWELRDSGMFLPEWLEKIRQSVLTKPRLDRYREVRPDDVKEFDKLVEAVSTVPRLQEKTVRSFGRKDAEILLTTFHSSKGLEFDTTIVVDLDGIAESQSTPGLKERLAYVAVSRARSKLYVLVLNPPGKLSQKLRQASIEELTYWTCAK